VINNTKDRTEEIVKRYQNQSNSLDYINLEKGGKGYAVIEGFKNSLRADFNLIGFVDSDMATSPEEYFKLIKNLKHYDGIIADRYMKGSKIFPKVTISRLAAKKLFNIVIRAILLLPFEDTQCGAKLFKSGAIEKTLPSLSMSKWAFDVDLLYNLRKKGFRVISYPTVWVDREYSKINFWQAGPWMVLGIIRLRIINSPLRRFVRIYDKLIKIVPR
jgi:hypothetical protein